MRKMFLDDLPRKIWMGRECYVEKHSMELFGVQVSNKHISSVCKGKRKTHKGLSFKYV